MVCVYVIQPAFSEGQRIEGSGGSWSCYKAGAGEEQ